MSSESQADTISRHRFFRAMVMMGGGIAVGCGGTTTDETSSSHGDGGDGGTGGDGGKSGTGGTIYLDAGAGRGGGSFGSGGRVGPVEAGPFPCNPAQWNCTTEGFQCSPSGMGLVLPENCACEPNRPTSADQCGVNQVFACRVADTTRDGRPLSQPLPFQCACVPDQGSCRATCNSLFDGDNRCTETGPTSRDVLCGCAVIVLR